jgi:hypothetical protein
LNPSGFLATFTTQQICPNGGYCNQNALCSPGYTCTVQSQYYSQCTPISVAGCINNAKRSLFRGEDSLSLPSHISDTSSAGDQQTLFVALGAGVITAILALLYNYYTSISATKIRNAPTLNEAEKKVSYTVAERELKHLYMDCNCNDMSVVEVHIDKSVELKDN